MTAFNPSTSCRGEPVEPSGYRVEDFLRLDIYEMEEYTPIEPFEVLSARLGLPAERIIKLDGNENPYGPSPRALAALADYQRYHIYPDPEHTLLREAIQDYVGVDKAHIMFGNGSDELIDLVMRLFLGPGDAIINCPPTFGMYSFDAALCRAGVVPVPRRADFSLNVEGICRRALETSPLKKLLFISSPNNPDGSLTSREDLLQLLELPLVVVIDEAYAEFSGTSLVDLVPGHPNLIVLRTFSKWAGLAGLRIGYGVFPLGIIRHLWKIKQPYNVNVAAQAAALASLEDLEFLQANVQRIVAERERLYAELGKLDFLHPYSSQSNFILCRVLGRDARQLKLSLERKGILIRYFAKPGLKDCIRISVGRPEQTEVLLSVLSKMS
jgi:histidinol-phosphate aminotransferase